MWHKPRQVKAGYILRVREITLAFITLFYTCIQETIPSPVEAKLLTNHSHDSGYADSHPNVSSNGWIPTGSAGNDTGVRSGTGLHQQRPLNHSGPTFAYEQTSNGVSSGGHRSLSGSNDSLLSEGSSSSQSQHGYLRRTSQPALPPKESRNSRNSARTTSSGKENCCAMF